MKVHKLKLIPRWFITVLAIPLVFALSACPAGDGESLTDAEIASVAVVANQIDVRYGELAIRKSDNPAVRHFAQTMINDHNSIIKQAGDLAEELGVTPRDNAVSQSLLDGEKEVIARLSKLEGLAFDKAYIQNEVDFHEAVISAVKDILIPQTQNEQLKNLLIKVSPLLVGHLDMAKEANEDIKTIPELSDAQIASIAVVANQIDVRYGKIALERTENPEVTHFARAMVKDHESIIDQAAALAQELGVTPDDDNPITQSLLAGEKETTAMLQSKSGIEFNKAYIDNEVAFHEAVIGAVKSILIPYTENQELKNMLVKVSPLLKSHLEMAITAQKTMK